MICEIAMIPVGYVNGPDHDPGLTGERNSCILVKNCQSFSKRIWSWHSFMPFTAAVAGLPDKLRLSSFL